MEATISRDGSGVYSYPGGGAAVSGAAISSTAYNTRAADVLADLNAARPISAGGTGATTAATARIALGVQASDALLTAIAALTTSADRFLKFTGTDTVAVFDLFGTANTFTATQTAGRWAVDTTAYFDLNSGNPVLAFDATDFFLFTRSSSLLSYGVGGITPWQILSTGEIVGYDVGPTQTTALGFRGTILNTQDADYTFVLADAAKTIYHTSASTHTYTIPANASVAYPIGTIIQIENENGGGNVTLAITSDTLRWDASTGSRTIAANGSASIKKVTSTSWRLVGTSIS
jgi:hypothetical protein